MLTLSWDLFPATQPVTVGRINEVSGGVDNHLSACGVDADTKRICSLSVTLYVFINRRPHGYRLRTALVIWWGACVAHF